METHHHSQIENWVRSYCPYCGVGCGLMAGVSNGVVTKIKGDPDHPSSLGDLCLKAVYLPETLKSADRLLYPQIRSCQEGPFKRASWEQAIKYLAQRFRAIIDEHGPDAVAFYGSGQLTSIQIDKSARRRIENGACRVARRPRGKILWLRSLKRFACNLG